MAVNAWQSENIPQGESAEIQQGCRVFSLKARTDLFSSMCLSTSGYAVRAGRGFGCYSTRQFSPADIAIVPLPGKVPGLSLPAMEPEPGRSRQLNSPASNRLMLFFLLLMAGVSGLLIEIATSRRQY